MNVIVCGSEGKMGKKTIFALSQKDSINKILKVDKSGNNIDIYKSLFDIKENADVIIDFSHHSASIDICKYANSTHTPVVFATTGFSREEENNIEELSKNVAIFKSGNMSVGIAQTIKLCKQVAILFREADCEIIEYHHNQKLDAPSGTAYMIANAIIESRGIGKIVYGREGMSKREKYDIGIHSVRAGSIVGIHNIIFDTGTQSIEIKHTAHDRSLFADGAIDAALYITKQLPGLYTMEDMLCE